MFIKKSEAEFIGVIDDKDNCLDDSDTKKVLEKAAGEINDDSKKPPKQEDESN